MGFEKNVGLVFAGGGGKGAWQLGVWKALEERGIRAKAVAGTSVGSLNAALYAQGNLETAVNAWMAISNDRLLQPNWDKILKLPMLGKLLAGKPFLYTHGLFSQNGLTTLLEKYVNWDARATFLPTFVAAHCKSNASVRYFDLFYQTQWSNEEAMKILLASSAIPHVFDAIEIEGKVYSDGGFDIIYNCSDGILASTQYNNIPVEPLINHGSDLNIENIIVLALNRDELLQRPHYGKFRVLPLLPSKSLGGIFDGCLDFDPKHAQKRMEQGYLDAQKWLDVIQGFADNEAKLNEIWQRIEVGEEDYLNTQAKISLSFSDVNSLSDNIRTFNQLLLADDGLAELEVAPRPFELEESLARRAELLLNAQERETIDNCVEVLIAENNQNSQTLESFAMDAIAALAPVESRSAELLEQGFFGRIWHNLTGKNHKANATSTLQLAQAQYASLMLIQKVQRQSLLSFEFSSALQSRLNRLASDVAQVQHTTNLLVGEVYRSMAIQYCRLRKGFLEHKAILDDHEQRIATLEWSKTIRQELFGGKKLSAYPPEMRLLLATLDFYRIADQQFARKNMLIFEDILQDLELHKEPMTLRGIKKACNEQRHVLADTLSQFRIPESAAADAEDWTPILMNSEAQITVSGDETPQAPVMIAYELLYQLQRNHWNLRRDDSDQAIKSDFLQRCDRLKEVLNDRRDDFEKNLIPQIDALKQRIQNYYLRVYLIGEFSCGKSSLLNAWLRQDLLPRALTPETAVASELFFGTDEKILLWPSDPSLPPQELPLNGSSLKTAGERANRKELLRIQLFLNNPQLRAYPDLCLVDMPGLNSGLSAHEFALEQFVLEQAPGIFCVPMEAGTLQTTELRFLEKMEHFRAGLYLLLTKIDDKPESDYEKICRYISDIMRNKLGIAEQDFKSAQVSAKNGNIQGFQDLLDALLDRRNEYFLAKYQEPFTALCASAQHALSILLNREFSCDQLDDAIEANKNLHRELPTLLKRWQQEINHKSSSIPNRIVERVKDTLRSSLGGFKAQLKAGHNCSQEITSTIRLTIANELQNESFDLFQPIIRKASEHLGQIVSCRCGQAEVSADSLPDLKTENYMGTGAGVGAGTGALAGAWLGSVIPGIGTLIGAGIGAIVGGLFGGYMGQKVEDDSKMTADLAAHLEQAAQGTASVIHSSLEESISKFMENLQLALENKLTSLSNQLEILKREKEAGAEQYNQQRQARQAALNAINEIANFSGYDHE